MTTEVGLRAPSTSPDGTGETRSRRRVRLALLAEPATYVASAIATVVATFLGLRLWQADLRVPFAYHGDAVAIAAHVKTVLETGWYEFQPLLGYPAGQTYHDFPTADNLNFAAAHVLGWFTSDWALATNLYYLVGFPLAAVAMVWFLREVGVSRAVTVAMSVLFAVAPYHFLRGVGHLWLASYFTLPLGLVVVLRAVRGEPLWGRGRRGGPVLGLLTGRGAVTVLCVGLVATASSYYAVFLLVLLASAGVAAWLRERDWRRFVGAAVAGLTTVAVTLANMLPDVLYKAQHGPSATGLVRDPAEVEIYALKLAQLLLPVPGHRVDLLAALRSRYDTSYPLVSEQPALGVVAAVGLVICFVVVAYTLGAQGARRRAELTAEQVASTVTIAHLSMLTFVAFLCATVGGLATFLSFVTASLRGWNRMSIVIAALCLAVVGLVVDAAVRAWARRVQPRPAVRRAAAWSVAGALLVVGCADQIAPGAVPDYDGTRAAFEADAAWVAAVERQMPPGGAVFRLPHAGFPETSPVNGVADTEQLKLYLHSATLHWSGGGIKGRAVTDWAAGVAQEEPAELVESVTLAGFDGIVVDRAAYGLERAGQVEAGIAARVGVSVAESADGRFALFTLAPEHARLAAELDDEELAAQREEVLAPVAIYDGHGVGATTDEDGLDLRALPTGDGTFTFDNPRDVVVPVRVQGVVEAHGAGHLVVEAPGLEETIEVSSSGFAALDVVVDVPPGHSTLSLVVRDDLEAAAPVTLRDLTVDEADVTAAVR